MKSYNALSLCVLLTAAAMTVAGPARHQRAADDTDNSIDVDNVKSEDITTDSVIAAANSDLPAPTDLELTSPAEQSTDSNPALTLPPRPEKDSDEEDDVMENSSSNNRGSNIFSLLNLVGQLFPGASGSNMRVRNLFQNFLTRNPLAIASIERYVNGMISPNRRQFVAKRRQDISDNEIEIDEDVSEVSNQSSEEKTEESSEEESKQSQSAMGGDSKRKSAERKSQEIEEEGGNTGAEESGEVANGKQSDESSGSDGDYDEPPGGGDGGGGGILGVIAGLSGGEDGQSDLGSLLATVSGIVVQLSGDGVDVNGLIASGLGLFVGLLSEGMENPGSIVASYINTALDTLSGGGSKNNGAFFGNFAGKILRGISMAPEGSSEEGGFKKGGGFDSAGFFLSLLMGFSGASSGMGKGMGEEE